MEDQFIYDLPYHLTEWGKFYKDFRELNQSQLVKYILKTDNERKEWYGKKSDPYQVTKIVQHIFYKTSYNPTTEKWETPNMLLKHSKHCDSYDYSHINKIAKKVFVAFFNRLSSELIIVKEYYQNQKELLMISQKEHHKQHANEKIQCPICGSTVGRTSISRHKKTNLRCLELQNVSS